MIIHILKIKVSPENRANAVRTLQSVSGPSRANSGCIASSIFNDVNNDDELMLIEKWLSMEKLDKHIASDWYKRLLELMELGIEEPSVEFHYISHSESKEYIEKCFLEKDSLT